MKGGVTDTETSKRAKRLKAGRSGRTDNDRLIGNREQRVDTEQKSDTG